MDYSQRHILNRNERSYHRWCVVRHLSNFQSIILTHFASRSEAEARVRFLNHNQPMMFYEVVFDESIITNQISRSWEDGRHQDF